jgi:predicted ArsR family transcriptional regulator
MSGSMPMKKRSKTRARILALLCGGERTADELARAIGVSGSAIRVHVGELEREGVITHERVIRGVGKPVHRYRLTRAGEGLLSRAYVPLTGELLDVLALRLTGEELEQLLREVGHRLADRQGKAGGEARVRVEAAVALLEALGGIVEIEWLDRRARLLGRCCPVSAVAADHPQICVAVEALLARYTGLRVRQVCDRSERPSCRFDISAPRSAAG